MKPVSSTQSMWSPVSSPPFPGFYLYYARRGHTPSKLKALVDLLRRRARAPQRP